MVIVSRLVGFQLYLLGLGVDVAQGGAHVALSGGVCAVKIVYQFTAVVCLTVIGQFFIHYGVELLLAHQFGQADGEYGHQVGVPVVFAPDVEPLRVESGVAGAELEGAEGDLAGGGGIS